MFPIRTITEEIVNLIEYVTAQGIEVGARLIVLLKPGPAAASLQKWHVQIPKSNCSGEMLHWDPQADDKQAALRR